MELDIWKGDWGIPSIDLTCLQILAYSKFTGAPVKINVTNWPLSRYGQLPLFRNGNKSTFTSFDNVVAYLQKQNYNADAELEPKNCADIIAYTALLRDKLYPALLYSWWVDAQNYVELTRPWYSSILAFPLNYFLPGKQKWKAEKSLENLYGSNRIDDSQRHVFIFKEAQECLNLLSYRLGEEGYFFGKSPCTLDAIVFGFLAPLLKAPFPKPTLQNHLKACTNLCQFVDKILNMYFPQSREEIEAQKLKEAKEREEKQEFPNKMKNMIFSGVFAGALMLGFLYSTRRS